MENNEKIKKLAYIISGVVLLLMVTEPSGKGLIFDVCIAGVLIWIERNINTVKTKIKSESKISQIVLGVIISFYIGWKFYQRWKYSTLVSLLFLHIGISHEIGLGIITGIGTILIIYSCLAAIMFLSQNSKNNSKYKFADILESKKLLVGCYCLVIILVIIQLYCSFSMDIWLDEAFSLQMIKHSYKQMILLTAQDVHPPLYYLMLKFFVNIISPKIHYIVSAKIFSLIPEIILLIYSVTVVRNKWGNFVSEMFAICLIGMPQLMSYAAEIRMYSWAMLFVTLSYFAMCDIIDNDNKKNWMKFILFSLLAAYTHYFACVSVSVLYIGLFVIFYKRDKAKLKSWFVGSVITVIGYFPWLVVFVKQLMQVKEDYWISDITFQSVIFYINFVFENNWIFLIYIICLLVSIKMIIENDHKGLFAFISLIMVLWTMFVGISVSKLMRPVFISRYMIPAMACIWFGIVVILETLKKIKIKLLVIVILLLLCVENTSMFVRNEKYLKVESIKLENFITKADKENSKIITTTTDNCRIISVKTKGTTYLWKDKNSELSKKVYENISEINDFSEVENWLKLKEKVYIIMNIEDNDIIDDLQKQKVQLIKIGGYQLGSDIVIYQLNRVP